MTATTFTPELPQEEKQGGPDGGAYERLLAKLSAQSVTKHYDAFADIPWDDPEYAIDPSDPRFALPADDPLARTAWYRSLPEETRARMGLHMLATFARIGWSFESVLKRGLLEFAALLPDDAPEFRYCYHEVIEEAQHSLFFHELVLRSGLDVKPPPMLKLGARQVIGFGRWFPELFFIFVLSGEDPIDWVQRRALASDHELHPLIERISRIHVTEEARHMAFARHYLLRHVPEVRGPKLFMLRLRSAIVMKIASALMMRPSRQIIELYGIPKATLEEAYGRGSDGALMARAALSKPRELCWELGILNDRWAPLWKALGIWAPRGATFDI